MHIILGATCHVGSATATTLLEAGQDVTVVTRDRSKSKAWIERGAKVAVADIRNPAELRAVLRSGKRALLLNPPAAPHTDTDAVERATVQNILEALGGSGLEKVVAQSTYGAQPGEQLGDLNTLFELETGLQAQPVPFAIIREAYYFSNWDALLQLALKSGKLPTMLPADLKIPMVAPDDLGRVAAQLLMQPVNATGTIHVEGPQTYSPRDVASAFSQALDRTVEVAVTPREEWEESFKKLGFSDAAAYSYTRMTAITADAKYEMPDSPVRGAISLPGYVNALAKRNLDDQKPA